MGKTSERKQDELLAKNIRTKFIHAQGSRTPREEAWNDARKRYDPSYIDKTKVKSPPYIKLGYTFRNVNQKLSQLIDASKANGRWCAVRSTTAEHGNVGEVLTQALENQFRRKSADLTTNNEESLERIGQSGILYGNAPIKVVWRDGGICFEQKDVFDSFGDWKHNRWRMIRSYATVAEMADLAETLSAVEKRLISADEEGEPIYEEYERDDGRARKAFQKLLKQVKEGRGTAGADRDIFSEYANLRQQTLNRVSDDDRASDGDEISPADDPYNTRVTVLEYHETRGDGMIVKMVPGFGDDHVDLIFQKDINPYGVCTVADFIPRPIDREIFGYGEGEIIGGQAEAMDYLYRSQIRIIAKNADAPLLIRRGLNLPANFLRSPTGKNVEVDQIDGSMAYLNSGTDQGLYNMAMNITRQGADLVTGESDIRRGQVGGANSATEAAIAESAGNIIDKLIFHRWEKFIEQIAYIALQVMKVHITEETAIPILGRDADTVLTLKPEFLEGSMEVEFGGTAAGMNPTQQISNWMNFVQSFGPTGVVDVAAIARKIARLMGEKNPDDVLTADAGRPQVSANHEGIAVFKNAQSIDVHQQDDDMQHLRVHMKDVQRVQQEAPEHPGIEAMKEHVQMHVFAMQQKMQQQQAEAQQGQGGPPQGGPPQGPPQAQPMQAPGGPGQPMSMQPGTAGVNQARQASNQAANGGAPGGVAPNRAMGAIMRGGPR